MKKAFKDKGDDVYPGWRQSVKLVIYLIILHLVVGLILVSLWQAVHRGEPPFWLLGLGGMVANVILIKYALKRSEVTLLESFGRKINAPTVYLAAILLVFGSSIVISELVNVTRIFVDTGAYAEIVQGMASENFLAIFVVVVVLAALLEELIFRAFIFRGLYQNYGIKFALFFSSLLFAVVHFNILQGFSAFLFGLLLGWLYWKFKSLLVPIFAHGLNNLLAVIFNRHLFIPGYSYTEHLSFQPALFTLFGGILFILGIYLIHHNAKKISE